MRLSIRPRFRAVISDYSGSEGAFEAREYARRQKSAAGKTGSSKITLKCFQSSLAVTNQVIL